MPELWIKVGGAGDELQGSRDGGGASLHTEHERWYTPFILARGRLKQENLETEVSLDYMVRLEGSLRYVVRFCLRSINFFIALFIYYMCGCV